MLAHSPCLATWFLRTSLCGRRRKYCLLASRSTCSVPRVGLALHRVKLVCLYVHTHQCILNHCFLIYVLLSGSSQHKELRKAFTGIIIILHMKCCPHLQLSCATLTTASNNAAMNVDPRPSTVHSKFCTLMGRVRHLARAGVCSPHLCNFCTLLDAVPWCPQCH